MTGKHVSFKGMKDLPPEGEENGGKAPPSPKKRKSKAKLDMKLDPMLWGVPGHLTEEEADVYVSIYYMKYITRKARLERERKKIKQQFPTWR